MSSNSDYSISESDEDYTSEESSVEMSYGASSSLLSNPRNQIMSSSSSGEEPINVSCAKVQITGVDVDSDSLGGDDEDFVELYASAKALTVEAAAAVANVTTNKVVPLSTVLRQPQMGTLTPMSTSAPKLLSSINEKELSQVLRSQENRLGALKPLAKKPNAGDELTPLTSLSATELEEVIKKQENRLSSMKSIAAPVRSSLLSSLSPETLDQVTRNQEKYLATKKASPYKLEKISDLSAEMKDELFIQQRKSLLSHIKPLDSLSVQELETLRLNCPWHDKLHATSVDQLSLEELRELVHECRLKHETTVSAEEPVVVNMMQHVMGVDSRKTMATQAKLAKRNTLFVSAIKKPDILLQSVSPLVNINTLPLEKQREIRQAVESRKTYTNSKSTVSAKKEFDLKFGATALSSANIQTLYHGTASKLACPTNMHSSNPSVHLMEHLLKTHPVYANLLKRHVAAPVLDDLMNSQDRNFMMVVPSKMLLDLYTQQGELLKLAQLSISYLTILLKRGETLPIDDKFYSCANLLKDNRVMVRRVDDRTLSIDNAVMARLDPASGGRVYEMVDEQVGGVEVRADSRRERDELVTEIVDELEAREQARAELEAEEALEEEEGNFEEEFIEEQVGTREGREIREPQVIVILPEASANSLSIVPIRENTTRLRANISPLAGVYRSSAYKNRKIETLASKMLNADYSGAKHMANYIEHSGNKEDGVSQLFLKTFAYDDLYHKYQSTNASLVGTERLTPVDSLVISASDSLNYALDSATKMREFTVDTRNTKITKGQLINHFAVICFKMSGNEYATLSFSLPDETKSLTDTYMSSDESLLLKFKENILASVVINTSSPSLSTLPLAEPLRKRSLITGRSTNVTQLLSVSVPMAENMNKLYNKELSFNQFLGLVIPLSQPGFIEQQLLGRGGRGQRQLRDMNVLSLRRITPIEVAAHIQMLGNYVEVNESTDRVMIGVGDKLKEYAYHRVLLRHPARQNEFMVRYDFDDAINTGQLSFNSLINYANAMDRPVLSMRLIDPMMRKRKLFRFQLTTARRPPQNEESMYEARTADGLHFDFRLVQGAKLEQVYIRYSHNAGGGGRMLVQPERFEQDMAKFLASEAYAYKKLNLNIVPSYMSQRLAKFFALSELARDKLDVQRHTEFFASLQKEIDSYMEQEKLSALLNNAPDTKLTTQKQSLIESSGYKVPLQDETKQFKSVMLSGFALNAQASPVTPTNSRAATVMNAVIQEYATLSNNASLKEMEFALYMNRFRHIANYMMFAYKEKK